MKTIEPYKSYFWDFYDPLEQNVKQKIDYVLHIIITVQQIPVKFFKHIEDGIFEIRIETGGNIFRIFSFFDEKKLVILLQGFQKKTSKTPRNEIEKAKTLRRAYYDEKSSNNDQ